MKLRNWLYALAASMSSVGPACAEGYTNWAVPTNVELVSSGVLIKGDFGDPNNCGESGYIFVAQSDSRYKDVLSVSLAALMGQREMRFYSNQCTEVGFHWSGNVINENREGQEVNIK